MNMPLAHILRPQSLSEVVGQGEVLAETGALGRMVASGQLSSLILWGPPGCGKTTIARLLANETGAHEKTGSQYDFQSISATFSGVADLRQVFAAARAVQQLGRSTVLFVDEIHRFNRAQQDAFLPEVENGNIILIGATTENPSFALNNALLSRCVVVVLNALDAEALEALLQRAEAYLKHLLPLTDDARAYLKDSAAGDGRYLLNAVEQILTTKPTAPLDVPALQKFLSRRAALFDKAQEGHYNLISALHKAVRGSDVDAALYWLARMLTAGEDPRFLARRIVRMANEDIGMADPQAIVQAVTAWEVYERLGSPEGELALAQAVVYIATAPKSNALYMAYKAAQKSAARTGDLNPPKYAMNAPTKLMKEQGYSDGYIYDHDAPNAFSGLNYFPPDMQRQEFYNPVERGFEREIQKRLAYWQKLRDN